jgi:ABC-2 type transport system ATP-binding protein
MSREAGRATDKGGTMTAALETEKLTRRFGRTEAVNGLDLAVPEGSIFALLGPNGAGKTTTIKTAMNIIEPTAGLARVLGTDSRRLGPPEFRRIGYVSENQELPDWMTVEQFLAYCRPFYPTWDAAFEGQLLRQFDLPPGQRLNRLSRGMRMKAALLSSLAYRPRLLVLDEPFAGLDPLVREEFVQGVLELTADEGWTIFIASHDVDEVERLADWVAFINDGRLQFAEPVATLLDRFRQVEVTLPGPAPEALTPAPGMLPPEWLQPEHAGHVVRFVDTGYGDGEEARIRSCFAGAIEVTATPMPLRSIFVALARSYRTAASKGMSRELGIRIQESGIRSQESGRLP